MTGEKLLLRSAWETVGKSSCPRRRAFKLMSGVPGAGMDARLRGHDGMGCEAPA